MSAGTEMARRSDTAVKIDAEVVRQAKVVAAFRGISLAEYLSETLRPTVARDYLAESRKAAGDVPDAAGKASTSKPGPAKRPKS